MQVPKPSTCTVRRKIEFEASFSIKGLKISNDIFILVSSPKKEITKRIDCMDRYIFRDRCQLQYGSDFITNGRIFSVLRQCLVVH